MALFEFTEIGSIGDNAGEDVPVTELHYAPHQKRQAIVNSDRSWRRWRIDFRRNASARKTFDAFWRARLWTAESVLYKDADDYEATGVALEGTADGVNKTFSLPTTGEGARYYVVDAGDITVYDDGSPAAVDTIDTEARTVTLVSAPGAASVMTADLSEYRLRVKLVRRYEWVRVAPTGIFRTSLELQEVSVP